MKPSEPSRNESNSFFDEDARRRLEEICSEPSFLEQIEEIAVRYKLDICVIGNRKSFKERMRLLDTIEKATKKLLKALETGQRLSFTVLFGDDPRFISRDAAEVRLRALGHEPEEIAGMIEKAKTVQREGKEFVSARDLKIPSSLPSDARDALGGSGPNLGRLRC